MSDTPNPNVSYYLGASPIVGDYVGEANSANIAAYGGNPALYVYDAFRDFKAYNGLNVDNLIVVADMLREQRDAAEALAAAIARDNERSTLVASLEDAKQDLALACDTYNYAQNDRDYAQDRYDEARQALDDARDDVESASDELDRAVDELDSAQDRYDEARQALDDFDTLVVDPVPDDPALAGRRPKQNIVDNPDRYTDLPCSDVSCNICYEDDPNVVSCNEDDPNVVTWYDSFEGKTRRYAPNPDYTGGERCSFEYTQSWPPCGSCYTEV